MTSSNFSLAWNVAVSGGGLLSSSHYRLSGTLGQPVTGDVSSPGFTHRIGYWQTWPCRVFLHLLLRNN